MKNIFFKLAVLLYLLFWWINFEFLYRLNLIGFDLDINFYLTLFLFFASLSSFNKQQVFSDLWKYRFVLLYIFITSVFSFFYSSLFVHVPFNLFLRFIVQFSSLFIYIVVAVSLSYFIVFYSNKAYKYLLFGYMLLVLSVIFQFIFLQSFYVQRIFGFAGEPKALGIFLVPLLCSMYFVGIKYLFLNRILIVIFILILTFTLSSTAFLALFLSFLGIYYYQYNGKIFNIGLWIGLFSFFVLTFLAVFVFDFNEAIFGRIFNRFIGINISDTQTVIDFPFFGNLSFDGNDAPVARMLLDNPLFIFTGVGFGFQTVFSYEYMIKYDSGFLDKFYTGYITPNMAILNHLSNFGVLVFVFLLIDGLKSIKILLKLPLDSNLRFVLVYFSSWFIISFLVYEMTFKVIFLYIILKLINGHIKRLNHV